MLAVALCLGASLAPRGGQAADPRLDTALAVLEQAQNLLEASQPGTVPEQAERAFERYIERAIRLILRAMEQIEAAKDAVDNP